MTDSNSETSRLFRKAVLPAALVGLGVLIAGQIYEPSSSTQQTPVKRLAKDEVIVLRTPGGMLEVSKLVKNEEFGWSTKHTCPVIDCGKLLKATVTEIRVRCTTRIASRSRNPGPSPQATLFMS